MERTFHHDRDALHGMTVVLTGQGVVHVGRCDDIRGGHILLLDVGWHRDGEDPGSRDEYLRKAVAFGVFPRARRLELPMEQVESIALLGELARGAGDA